MAGRCWEEGGAPPYWPWIQVLRSVGGDLEHLATASQPAGSVARGGVIPEGERIRLFDEVSRYLARGIVQAPAPRRPSTTCTRRTSRRSLLLRFIGRRARGRPHPGGRGVSRRGAARPRAERDLRRARASGNADPPTRPRTRPRSRPTSSGATGAQPSGELVAQLHEITAGNPFFVEEVVRQLSAGANLERHARRTRRCGYPRRSDTLIRRRVATLPAEAVAVLRIAAVIGREFDLHLLQHASRLTPCSPARGARRGGGRRRGRRGARASGPVLLRARADARDALRRPLAAPAGSSSTRRSDGCSSGCTESDLDPHLSEIARHLYLAAPARRRNSRALDFLIRAGKCASAAVRL